MVQNEFHEFFIASFYYHLIDYRMKMITQLDAIHNFDIREECQSREIGIYNVVNVSFA